MTHETRLHVEILPSGRHARLLDDHRVKVTGFESAVMPRGFVSDFASVPRIFWWILPPWGKYGPAAALHDYRYATGIVPRWVADAEFYEYMRVLEVRATRRFVMWFFVRLFGWRAWREHRRREAKS